MAERALAAFTDLPQVETAVLVTHSATAMALTIALLGLDQRVHVLGPLANCHWSELTRDDLAGRVWRLRAHNIGTPGVVVPLPLAGMDIEDASDAEA